jgi:5-(carboxyamino)imidazole ribonucleotide synthase
MHIGIIGCGQLARLMALAGKPMGFQFSFVAIGNESTSCVEELGHIVQWHDKISASELLQALGNPDVITVEREDVDVSLLVQLAIKVKVHPSPKSVATCQNRLLEKLALSKLKIPSTPWLSATNSDTVKEAVELFKFPLVIKSLEQGYDGKNQWQPHNQLQLDELLQHSKAIDWIIEPKIDFIKETSLIGVRSSNGETTFYPLTENYHEKGILRTSVAPDNSINDEMFNAIKDNLERLLNDWQYVGVMAMELFILPDGFVVNELAPRVHNSGHWTDQSNITSQFENHLRAILGMPIGCTEFHGFAGMINILGTESNQSMAEPIEGKLHLYNKSHKQNRKLGHINFSDSSRNKLLNTLSKVERDLYQVNFFEKKNTCSS